MINERAIQSRDAALRLGAAFVLGGAGALVAFLFGTPGNGAFVPAAWLAGFAAAVVAPGWRGFAALIGGASAVSAIVDIADGSFGLVILVVAIVSALAAHGALSAWVLLRLRALGPSRGVRDGRLVLAGLIALSTVVIFVWFAHEFAQGPA